MLATQNLLMVAAGAMVVALEAVGAGQAEASTLFFSNEAGFLSSTSNSLSLESFEGLPALDSRASRDETYQTPSQQPTLQLQAFHQN